MKKYYLVALVSAILVAMLFGGCAASSDQNYASEKQYYGETEYAEEPMDMDTAESDYVVNEETSITNGDDAGGSNVGLDSATSILEPSVDRKIIYSGRVDARTKKFDKDYSSIMDKLAEVGGYIENAYMHGTEPGDWQDNGRYVEITLRVPSDKFDAFMTMLDGLGENISSSISGTDVSLQYYDTETRLSTLRIRETRLQVLLEQAAGLEDIIEIERELSDVSYEIQSHEIELRSYDSLIDFSTITVTLQEVNDITAVTPSEESVGTRISNGFYSVLNVLADFGEGLIIFVIAGSPVILLLAAIIIVIVLLVKRSNKKHMKKAVSKTNDQQQGGHNDEK